MFRYVDALCLLPLTMYPKTHIARARHLREEMSKFAAFSGCAYNDEIYFVGIEPKLTNIPSYLLCTRNIVGSGSKIAQSDHSKDSNNARNIQL